MNLNEQQVVRLQKVSALREAGIDPYPGQSFRTHRTREALDRYIAIEPTLSDGYTEDETTVTGRVITVRNMGKSSFTHIEDGSGSIQLYLRANNLDDDEYENFIQFVDRGDFVEATGRLFRTRTGEISVEVRSWRMLAKAISPPPEKWHGLADVEQRYRMRYVDLFANPEVKDIFRTRTKVISSLRSYLDSEGFLEVETPTLQPLYGGALAQPFTTHHNALDQTLYLRIADELYLKRLIVGGFERVYEICKDFRNEGVDRNHNPEFTMLEFYMAYSDYTDVMEISENMLSRMMQDVTGDSTITYQGQEIDFTTPWRRLALSDAIFEACGIDYESVRDQQELYRRAKEVGVEIHPDTVWPKIVDELLKTFVRPELIQPTFLINYPVELSPLAKKISGHDNTVERFQIFIGGFEMGNAYTELNDPVDQYRRFLAQVEQRAAGDEDTMPIDIDYVEALMYGMPPTGGYGLGIDRLVMLLTNQTNVREVILFPPMRTKEQLETRIVEFDKYISD